MSQTEEYDLIVLGGGPAGYSSAIRASQLQMKVAIVEKDQLGGVCLNVGCIPSKSLIHNATLFNSTEELKKLGVGIDFTHFDYKKVQSKSRRAALLLSKGVQYLIKKNNITLYPLEGRIKSQHEISLSDGCVIKGKYILIATGSTSKELPGFPFDEESVLSSTGFLMQEKLPKSIIILGAGAIGIEFAYILNAFGVNVTLVEALDNVLPGEDEEIIQVLTASYKKKGIKILAKTSAQSMIKSDQGVHVTVENREGEQQKLSAEQVIVSVGRSLNTVNIGLEEVNIKTENGFIPVKDYYQTDIDNIYAVGDIINTPMLAHVASKEGEIAVEHMAGLNPEPKINPHEIPFAVYSEPQIARFGYSEQNANDSGIPYKKSVFPYRGVGKSVAIEKSEGMIKILTDPDNHEILGAHIVGSEATELIHEVLLAKSMKLSPNQIADMIHAHPTLSEGIMEVMKSVDGRAIHI